MGYKRNRLGHNRKRAVALAHAEQVNLARLQEDAALVRVECEVAHSPEFAEYRRLVNHYGPEAVANAVLLAADLPWADLDSPVAQPQQSLPNAPNGDRSGPRGRALVNEMAELMTTAREARKAGRA